MLLIRKARPLLWDQPSSKVCIGRKEEKEQLQERRERDCGAERGENLLQVKREELMWSSEGRARKKAKRGSVRRRDEERERRDRYERDRNECCSWDKSRETGRRERETGMKRREGVVPGSTNQGQDAIDRHVARGWFNGSRQGGGLAASASALKVVVAATRKEVEVG